MDVEKASRAMFDEMRQIIGDNRISHDAFLSVIARGLLAAIAEERKACAEIVHQEYLAYTEGGFSASQCLVDAEKKILARARSDEKPP